MATKKKTKLVEAEPVEISSAEYSREGWKFYVNDERVTEEEYIAIMDEHLKWVKAQEELAAAEAEPEKKTKRKKR